MPEGKLVRTTSGGTDALKKVLVDLKRYSFTGYVKAVTSRNRAGYVVVSEGNPELAIHVAEDEVAEGKVALKAIWEDSYSEKCSLEIHAKVDVAVIRSTHPNALLERVKKPVRTAPKLPTGAVEEKLQAWRDSGYDVSKLSEVLEKGGADAARALRTFEGAVGRMEPLRRELEGMNDPALAVGVAELKEQARNPTNVEAVVQGLARLKGQTAESPHPPSLVPADARAAEASREQELQDRARQVFEMIVRHRAAEGKSTEISESQVARAIEGRAPTRDEKTNLIRQYTFDAFVVGPSNRFAHAAALAVAKSPHTAYNPLFITSGPGLGKTHLLNGIGNAILAENESAKVVYITAEGFSNEFKEASAAGRLGEFREKYRTLDVALLDDAHFLSGKGDVQEELFHTFNDLYNANKQIVLTSDRPPKEIPDLEDRLISRFESGLIADIQSPEYETRLAILRRRARDAGIAIEEEVLTYIARRVENNIRELGGALNRVIAFSSLMGQPVSLDLAKEVLKDIADETGRGGGRVAGGAEAITPGHCYLVEEDRPEHAFRILNSGVGKNGRALLITRSNPKRVREKHDLNVGRILWLTERESSTTETIPPSLERIIYVIEEFMKEGGKGAILIDGVEYLVGNNSFDAVLKFLRRLVDDISESQFVLLVSVSTKTMKEQEIKNLEREMEVLTF